MTLSRKTAKDEALPKGWRRAKLGDIYNISASGDLDAKATSLTQDEKHPYPIYSNALTNKGLHSYSSYAKYDEDSITITARGDVGFANHRTTKFMAIGRLLVLKNKVPISNKFVCEYINHRVRFFKEITGVPQLTVPQASKYHVILPSLPEQKVIASLLETWDTAIEKTEALIVAKEKQFKWLLKTLISDQQNNLEWRQVDLGEISICYSGGTPSTQVPEYYDGKIPFINSGDLNQRHIKSVKGKLSILGIENSSAKFVKENTLLMALYGATAGVVAVTHIDAVINQAVLAIVVKENQYSNFIFFVLEQIKDTLVNKYRQGGQPNLSAKIIKSIKLRLPSLPEQKRIANILDTANKEVEVLKHLTEQYRTQKRGLMQKLLTGKWRIQIGDN